MDEYEICFEEMNPMIDSWMGLTKQEIDRLASENAQFNEKYVTYEFRNTERQEENLIYRHVTFIVSPDNRVYAYHWG